MIPLYKVYMPGSISDEMTDILYSGKVSYGAYASQFEKTLREYLGTPYVVTTSNNTYASLIAFSLLQLKPGDEVIASPMACLASNQPALSFNVSFVWADIDPLTGTLDPENVEKKITSRTKVILHYHWCGYPGYIDEINAIGKAHGITVIDDGIESFGSEYKGKKIGNTGTDLTIFSFQAVRLPNSIDGGAICFKDAALFEKALRMRDFGIDRSTFRDADGEISPQSDIRLTGFNAMMNELSGFIGYRQMQHVDHLLAKQRENAAIWKSRLKTESPKLIPLSSRNETNPNYWVYSLLSDERDVTIKKFREQNFYASKVHLRNDYYSCFGPFNPNLKGVEEFEKKQLSIPSGWWINLK